VLEIGAPVEKVVARLSTRLECPVCHRTYNPAGAAPRDGVHCDDHPEVELIHRVDDDVEKIRRRIEVFHAETAPLAAYYAKDGRLRRVEGMGEVDEVEQRVRAALDDAASGAPRKEARA
jgi:adenylate kinase